MPLQCCCSVSFDDGRTTNWTDGKLAIARQPCWRDWKSFLIDPTNCLFGLQPHVAGPRLDDQPCRRALRTLFLTLSLCQGMHPGAAQPDTLHALFATRFVPLLRINPSRQTTHTPTPPSAIATVCCGCSDSPVTAPSAKQDRGPGRELGLIHHLRGDLIATTNFGGLFATTAFGGYSDCCSLGGSFHGTMLLPARDLGRRALQKRADGKQTFLVVRSACLGR